ncbi:GATA transcription factor 1 [Corylus avellana]|uniref:GATA transcription factor 1 n=1 Tax=Corylus avellana TaxID=13451 RepID=UPI00286B0FFA|nr:GATA transcription factor 1 [Corylus avellana]
MEAPDTACLVDDFLDFASDIGEEDDEEEKPRRLLASLDPNGPEPAPFDVLRPDDSSRLFPEIAEEELEWISNKDSFPEVETFVDILSGHPGSLSKHHSPVSVLESSTTSTHSNNSNSNSTTLMSCCGSLKVPVRARSKRRRTRRRDMPCQLQHWWTRQQPSRKPKPVSATTIGRKCQHCGAEKTPQWRAGPAGPKTLCNACGVRYKSGRLVPEYRPASSPTYSAEEHSNSHRKILEMRKHKYTGMGMGIGMVVKPVDKG